MIASSRARGSSCGTFSTGYGALTPQHTPQYPYDPEAARALFAEAGYTERGADGILQRADGTRLSVSFTYVPSEKLLCSPRCWRRAQSDAGLS